MSNSSMPFALFRFPINAAHAQARHDAAAAITAEAISKAVTESVRQRQIGGARLYRDTSTRAQWRGLFNAAVALPDVVIAVTYLKDDLSPRTMLCQPYEVNSDYTKRYVTVWDIESGDYRRVNLDAIVKLTMETHSMPEQF